jgi:hypothetical protein
MHRPCSSTAAKLGAIVAAAPRLSPSKIRTRFRGQLTFVASTAFPLKSSGALLAGGGEAVNMERSKDAMGLGKPAASQRSDTVSARPSLAARWSGVSPWNARKVSAHVLAPPLIAGFSVGIEGGFRGELCRAKKGYEGHEAAAAASGMRAEVVHNRML